MPPTVPGHDVSNISDGSGNRQSEKAGLMVDKPLLAKDFADRYCVHPKAKRTISVQFSMERPITVH